MIRNRGDYWQVKVYAGRDPLTGRERYEYDRARTPQTCDPRCRACRIHRRPFYGHAELQYLEHGSGPLAAELERLWRAKGTMKGGTARHPAGHDDDNWPAPRGAAGLARRRAQARTVTDLYYPGLQDPPPGQDGRNAGSGQ